MAEQIRDLELTAEEQAKPYAKYFYQKPVDPPAERLEPMKKPMDPAKALPIENINDLLDPGYHEVESGWCILDNGMAYIANHTPMPGVTVDMVNWWFAWHGLEDLRYKMWWPAGHYGVSVSDRDREKILDPNTAMTDRFQGITHYVIENVGGPCAEKIAISFMTPEDLGFDMDRFKPPAVGTVVGANGVSLMLDPPPGMPTQKSPAVMVHFIREIDGGVEFRTRFWMGYHIVDKIPYKLLPKGIRLPEMAASGLATHNVYEYHNLASFLPKIYEEQGGMVS